MHAIFWKRFAAWVVDGLVVSLLIQYLQWSVATGTPANPATLPATDPQHQFFFEALASASMAVAASILIWTYFAAMESSKLQATLGKLALGLKVTDMDGRRVSFGKASGRFFGKYLSALMLGIGYLMAGYTLRQQAFHDMISGCLVIEREEPSVFLAMPIRPGDRQNFR